MASPPPLIAAPATPPGESAVCLLRVSGAGALQAVRRFVELPSGGPEPRVATLGSAHDGGAPLDRVLVTFFPGPHSYTGEDLVEISAHGSPFILRRLLELAGSAGARPAEPGEFTLRAFLNGRLDLAQAEAVGRLIRARTRLAHRAALDQLEGGLSRRVADLRARLLASLAHVEAGLDHPEEDLPRFSSDAAQSDLDAARAAIAELLSTQRAGRLAEEGARISIVGAPNAGKSSLLNALLGRDRAIVSDRPGTTRDTLEERADWGGLQTLLTDTAGLRETTEDAVEREGMRRTRRSLRGADLALVVIDRSRPLDSDDRRALAEAAGEDGRPVVIALNKCDLPARVSAGELGRCVEVSALRGDGLGALRQTVARALAGPASTADGGVVVAEARHHRALEEADAALALAGGTLERGELAAVHLREALCALGAIVGETAPEDVLREIFSRFCIGK